MAHINLRNIHYSDRNVGPKDHISMRILQTMVFCLPLVWAFGPESNILLPTSPIRVPYNVMVSRPIKDGRWILCRDYSKDPVAVLMQDRLRSPEGSTTNAPKNECDSPLLLGGARLLTDSWVHRRNDERIRAQKSEVSGHIYEYIHTYMHTYMHKYMHKYIHT